MIAKGNRVRKLDDAQMAAMIAKAAQKPEVRRTLTEQVSMQVLVFVEAVAADGPFGYTG